MCKSTLNQSQIKFRNVVIVLESVARVARVLRLGCRVSRQKLYKLRVVKTAAHKLILVKLSVIINIQPGKDLLCPSDSWSAKAFKWAQEVDLDKVYEFWCCI